MVINLWSLIEVTHRSFLKHATCRGLNFSFLTVIKIAKKSTWNFLFLCKAMKTITGGIKTCINMIIIKRLFQTNNIQSVTITLVSAMIQFEEFLIWWLEITVLSRQICLLFFPGFHVMRKWAWCSCDCRMIVVLNTCFLAFTQFHPYCCHGDLETINYSMPSQGCDCFSLNLSTLLHPCKNKSFVLFIIIIDKTQNNEHKYFNILTCMTNSDLLVVKCRIKCQKGSLTLL